MTAEATTMLGSDDDREAALHVRLQTVMAPCQAFINGVFASAASGERFALTSPVLRRSFGDIPLCGKRDVDRAVRAAAEVFEKGDWSRALPATRKQTLFRLAEFMEEQSERLAFLEAIDTGKPYREALSLDVAQSIARLRWYAELADKTYGEIAPTAVNRLGLITREPVGVVAAIVPWNFPLMMAVTKLAPALVAGNSVILKPSELSSLTALALAEIAAKAELPNGVLQVLTGTGSECGRLLAEHDKVDAVTFTGSTLIGARIMGYAASSNMKRVSLECGGKSPHLVLDPDAVDDSMVEQIAWGICYNQGQVCDAGSSLILVGDGYDKLLADLAGVMGRMSVGDPFDDQIDLGSMISRQHVDKVDGFVSRALASGVECAQGAKVLSPGVHGSFYAPTLLAGVVPDSELFQEEIFGPVLSVTKVATIEAAVELVNSSRYGLAAAVWSGKIQKAANVASRLRVGIAAVNTFELGDVTTPFGGFRQSGLGRDRSVHALANYTELKTTWVAV